MGKRISLETWINIIKHYTYFNQGFGILNFAKYFVAIFGVASFVNKWSMKWTMFMLLGYMLLCYFAGWLCYHTDFMRAQNEFGNRYNPFCDDMRAAIKKRKHRKL